MPIENNIAGYETPEGVKPGYLTLTYRDADTVLVTMRGNERPEREDRIGDPPRLAVPLEDFQQLIADFQHLRPGDTVHAAGTADEAGVPLADETVEPLELTEDMRVEGEPDSGGATAGDPLGQRADEGADGGKAGDDWEAEINDPAAR